MADRHGRDPRLTQADQAAARGDRESANELRARAALDRIDEGTRKRQ